MHRIARMFGLVVLCGAMAGCETLQQRVTQKEDLLAAAGFMVRPANSPAREAELRRLPAHKFVTHTHGDVVTYIVADPLVCNCLYVGSQADYDRYKHEVFTRQIADEQQMTAETNQESFDWGGWDWGPWGMGAGGIGPDGEMGWW